jgi:hypothetical protein
MKYLLQHNINTKSSRIGLVCNQTAWNISSKKYSFQWLVEKGMLKKVFIPEQGFFGELQYQEASPLVHKPSLQQLKIK